MKFSGVVLAIAAAMPLASAVPFRMGNLISGVARAAAPEPVPEPAAPIVEVDPRNLTTRGLNETEVVAKRSVNLTSVEPRNVTVKA